MDTTENYNSEHTQERALLEVGDLVSRAKVAGTESGAEIKSFLKHLLLVALKL